MRNGDAESTRNRADSGGTDPGERKNILASNGVPSTLQNGSMANITQAVAEGRGVITSHDVAILWGPGNSGGHAVVVTGAQYDANGNLTNIIYNLDPAHSHLRRATEHRVGGREMQFSQ
ncbi:MAG: hypothetical protein LAP87_30550 [Acidobacteriia bacterium]|nr:hypothetical protein [Terriglobia bacterium]